MNCPVCDYAGPHHIRYEDDCISFNLHCGNCGYCVTDMEN